MAAWVGVQATALVVEVAVPIRVRAPVVDALGAVTVGFSQSN